MLARLILALLLAAFAVPAAAPAACHDAPTSTRHATMVMAGDPVDATSTMPDRKAIPPHGCIGCIPPSNWNVARIVAVTPNDRAMLVERATVLDIGTASAPALPPPRTA